MNIIFFGGIFLLEIILFYKLIGIGLLYRGKGFILQIFLDVSWVPIIGLFLLSLFWGIIFVSQYKNFLKITIIIPILIFLLFSLSLIEDILNKSFLFGDYNRYIFIITPFFISSTIAIGFFSGIFIKKRISNKR